MKSYIVDSFTKEAFKGNPAGVCFPGHELTDETMLKIAQEFGFSETAFVKKTSEPNTYEIRFFSPRKEIPLCGHATLASASVIFKHAGDNEIHFITVENINLLIKKEHDEIVMEFPVYDTVDATVPSSMLQALGLTDVNNTAYSPKNNIILLEINDAELLAGLHPDFNALMLSYSGINGVLVTSQSDTDEYDYHYRYFWPWSGTNEDPVTGGVQSFLAKYWSKKLGKKIMKAYQLSYRTGYMSVELQKEKVLIKGSAVIISEGSLVAFE